MSTRWLTVLRLRIRTWLRRDEVEQELNEEISFHLERQIEANRARGLSASAARTAALRTMGGIEPHKERCRDAWHVRAIEQLGQDLRYAARTLRRAPVFTTVAVLSLALGIGANSALFSFLDTMLLARVPVSHPEELLLLGWSAPSFPQPYVDDIEGSDGQVFSKPVYEQIQRDPQVFSSAFAFTANDATVNLGLAHRAVSAQAEGISGNFFGGLGVRPWLGRLIKPADDAPSAPAVVVLSTSFWQRSFGSDPAAVGTTMRLNNQPVTIVGVAPPEFFGLRPGTVPDVWIPLSLYANRAFGSLAGDESIDSRRVWWLTIAGRLRPGVSAAAAQARLGMRFAQGLVANTQGPVKAEMRPILTVASAERGLEDLRRDFSKPLLLLMAMVGLVLLIACANVAGLLLTKAAVRQPEIATRTALGARRLRIVRQLLTESMVLAALGGAAGLLIAAWLRQALSTLLASASSPIVVMPRLDLRSLLFTLGVATLSGLVFGLAPALRAGRPRGALQASSRTTQRGAARTGRILVAGQVALGLVLLVGAGLCIRSLDRLLHVQLGYNSEPLVVFRVMPGLNGYTGDRLIRYYQDLEQRVRVLPGVQSVGISLLGPVAEGGSTSMANIPGVTPVGTRFRFHRHRVDSGWFPSLGLPAQLGRLLGPQDRAGAPRVAVVNQRFVLEFMPGVSPLGRTVRMGESDEVEIVGVVRDLRTDALRDAPPPTLYLSYEQLKTIPYFMSYVVRCAGDPRALLQPIERAALGLDPSVPVSNLRTETQVISQSLFLERTFALLSGGFGLVALVLACIGLFGTLSYAVSRRRNEIGVRMALGASRSTILGSVLRETVAMVVAGLLVGLPAAWAAGRLLASQLFGLSEHDPATLVGAALALVGATLIAGWLPARQASAVDPAVALRAE